MAKHNKRGVFVCIEGVDGSGKTTQAKRLVENLCRRDIDAVYTIEPSAGTIGKLIRSFVLTCEKRVPVVIEALLFAADRVEHIDSEIRPLLEQGKAVVCDRYVYSSYAYQGAAGLDLSWIERINRFALKPDVALLVDVPIEIAFSRLKKRRSVMETAQNLANVRKIYLDIMQKHGLILVKGEKSLTEVSQNILEIVLQFLKIK